MQIGFLITLGLIFLVVWLFTSFILYLAGRVVSGENAKFTDALLITLIGNILNVILLAVFTIFIAPLLILVPFGAILVLVLPWIIVLFVYIWLVMRFFDTGILGAIAVGLIIIVISIIIGVIIIIAAAILLIILGLFP